MIINEDGLRLLKSLADSDDIKIKRAVCNAFANLCSDGTCLHSFYISYVLAYFFMILEDSVDEVLSGGGLKMIIGFLDSGDDELIAGALHTLANVASAGNYFCSFSEFVC